MGPDPHQVVGQVPLGDGGVQRVVEVGGAVGLGERPHRGHRRGPGLHEAGRVDVRAGEGGDRGQGIQAALALELGHLAGRGPEEDRAGQVHAQPAARGGGADLGVVLHVPGPHHQDRDGGHGHHLAPGPPAGHHHDGRRHGQPLDLVARGEEDDRCGGGEVPDTEAGPAGPEVADQAPRPDGAKGGGGVGVVEPVLIEQVRRRGHHAHQCDAEGRAPGYGQLHQQPVGAEHHGQAQGHGGRQLDRAPQPAGEVEEEPGIEVEQRRLAGQVPHAGHEVVTEEPHVEQLPHVGQRGAPQHAVVVADPGDPGGCPRKRVGHHQDDYGQRRTGVQAPAVPGPVRRGARRLGGPGVEGGHGCQGSDRRPGAPGGLTAARPTRRPGGWADVPGRRRTRPGRPGPSGPAARPASPAPRAPPPW